MELLIHINKYIKKILCRLTHFSVIKHQPRWFFLFSPNWRFEVYLSNSSDLVYSYIVSHSHRNFNRWPFEHGKTCNRQKIWSEIHSPRNPKEILIELKLEKWIVTSAIVICVEERQNLGKWLKIKKFQHWLTILSEVDQHSCYKFSGKNRQKWKAQQIFKDPLHTCIKAYIKILSDMVFI